MGNSKSLGEFSTKMYRLGEDWEPTVTAVMRRSANVMQSELINNTPKKTGHASANWKIGIDAPSDGVVFQDEASTITSNEALIGGFSLLANRTIHLTNNVSYIGKLNAGSSSQAPANFIQSTIKSVLDSVTSEDLDTLVRKVL